MMDTFKFWCPIGASMSDGGRLRGHKHPMATLPSVIFRKRKRV